MFYKPCITLALISIICASIVAAILVIPLIVIPSVADEVHNLYDPIAARCYVQNVVRIQNSTAKCKAFSSCNQGCSKWEGTCERVVVKYWYKAQTELWEDPAESQGNLTWQMVQNVSLRINGEGCGDGPRFKCQDFWDYLISLGGNRSFNCYRNLKKAEVVYNYEFIDPTYPAWVAISLPLILLLVAGGGTLIFCIRYMRKYKPRNALDLEEVDCSRRQRHAFE